MVKSKAKKEKKQKKVIDKQTKLFRKKIMIIFGVIAVIGIVLGILT